MRATSRGSRGVMLVLWVLWMPGCGDDDSGAGNNNTGSNSNNTNQSNDNNSNQSNDNNTNQVGAWLYTEGSGIHRPDGTVWQGRGANIHDTRSCNACTWGPPNVDEVKRRIDALVDDWGADFMRLTLESYASADGRTHWQSFLDDADYLADIVDIVDHVGTKPGVYILVSLWIDPGHSAEGWPTAETITAWQTLAQTFLSYDNVLFGLINEPESNFDGSQDAACWTAMNDTVQAIRDVEDSAGTPRHLVSVQGTRAWARVLDYYITNPITAGGGENIVYETHVYDAQADFADRFETPSQTLPVIYFGEFGPDQQYMTEADCTALMDSADNLQIPYLAWTFHQRCPPNLLVENSGGGCGVDMALEPTAWGQLLMDRLLGL